MREKSRTHLKSNYTYGITTYINIGVQSCTEFETLEKSRAKLIIILYNVHEHRFRRKKRILKIGRQTQKLRSKITGAILGTFASNLAEMCFLKTNYTKIRFATLSLSSLRSASLRYTQPLFATLSLSSLRSGLGTCTTQYKARISSRAR